MDNDKQPEQTIERLNPLNDFAFQKAMGEKGDEPQLISFLNAVLERTGRNRITQVSIADNKEIPAETAGGKLTRLDVLATLEDGAKVNIEVQNRDEFNMEKRSPYHWALKYTRDFRQGQDYAELVPVICINILDFGFIDKIDDFHTSFHIREDQHPDIMLSDVFEIHYLDMVKFRKLLKDKSGKGYNKNNPLHRWLAFLNENSPEEIIEEVLRMDPALKYYESKMDEIRRDPAMMRAYDNYAKTLSDWTSSINGAERRGIAIGEQRG
ncbi:MAG: Rpn family recombination-promoting nuclease/putative transposase, partial [Spirochaetaceae bacterium]|nr:Rpn family recombination-promoting nuclease/putative transposase [Spirochaetaceae bacterium]